jgi:protein-S-isoprenylcysteine O-methyltransferase Ste14
MLTANGLLVGTEWEFRYRGPLIFFVCGVAVAISLIVPDPFTNGRLWIELPWMCGLAFAVALAGVTIRVSATGHLSFDIIAAKSLRTPRLVDTGPYSITRNPLYLGSWLAVSSLGLVLNLWAALLLPAMMAMKVLRVIGFEERSLPAAFGTAYSAYAARVPRLVPRSFSRIRRALREKNDWLYGIKGNLFMLGLPAGYLGALFRPSLGIILACVCVGYVAQWAVVLLPVTRRG